jgi:hypothetical protein
MSKRIWSVVPLAFSLAAIAAAQTSPTSPRVTVIGCIERSKLATASLGTSGVRADQTDYLLTNVTLADAPSAAIDGASALISDTVGRYRLQDSADDMIAPHVGERVEVTGTVVAPSESATGTTGTEYDALRGIHAPLLRVQSVRKAASESSACSH